LLSRAGHGKDVDGSGSQCRYRQARVRFEVPLTDWSKWELDTLPPPPKPGETGTGGDCGNTSELLGLRLGTGGTTGGGGNCANAPVTEDAKIAIESK
jgi:hypothetical protein